MLSGHEMLISGLILAVAYFFIATEKIQKSVVALLGASLTLLLGLLPQYKADGLVEKAGQLVHIKSAFEYVEFDVIFLLIGMMIIVHIATRSGMFDWVAVKLLHLTQGRPKKVLFALALFTAFASAFLDNVTTVVLIMPITFAIAKELEISPIPFLITEALVSNIGGTATLIGDPPNIIIGLRAGITFMQFLTELTEIIVLIFLVCIAVLIFMFRKQLVSKPEKMKHVAGMTTVGIIKDKALVWRSGLVLLAVILGFVTHDITHVASYVCAMMGASVLLIFESPKEIYEDVEWLTIFFFIGLFIIIGGFEASGGIDFLAQKLIHITNGSLNTACFLVLWGSGILSGLIDNIPYTATMVPMIEQIQYTMPHSNDVHPLWWALSLGACLGGNFTIIGAAANVIVCEKAASEGFLITFWEFFKYGSLVSVISLVMSSVYLYWRFLI